MNILITGVDGYLGWPLALLLARQGHTVSGIDQFARRAWVAEVGSVSALPIASFEARLAAFRRFTGRDLRFFHGDLTDPRFCVDTLKTVRPDAVVYLGEMPSAPYSMMDAEHAIYTQTNNVMGTLAMLFALQAVNPDCHLVKLGTMGEYGTPKLDIPEGYFDVTWRGKTDRMLFPRKAGSWYHQSKVHDTHNVEMACRIWGLRATDIMQGVVYGTRFCDEVLEPALHTRFDFDHCFGTVINRFCAQAVIGKPLTPYGKGTQKRSFLALRDSMTCLTLALEHPAERSEYRTFNQFDRVYGIRELADTVAEVGRRRGLDVAVRPVANPRVESEDHPYNPDAEKLRALGYRPTGDLPGQIDQILTDLLPHHDRIAAHAEALEPRVSWVPRSAAEVP